MGDIGKNEASQTVSLVGADADGKETSPIGSSDNRELWVRDTHDNGGLDGILPLTTTPIEGKVGATVKPLRKYVIMEALTANVKWGFSNTTQSFDLFKNQLIMVPMGENTQIWFKVSVSTGSVAFGELS